CTYYPNRFVGACHPPLVSDYPDTSKALPELRRCIDEYSFPATCVTPDAGGRGTTPGMHEPYWYPLYEECEGRQLPIIVHASNAVEVRTGIVPPSYRMPFNQQQFVATLSLSFSDVFDRYPQLKVVMCHCGGGLDRFVNVGPEYPARDT